MSNLDILKEMVKTESQEDVLTFVREQSDKNLYLWYLLIYGRIEECCELFDFSTNDNLDFELIFKTLACIDHEQGLDKYTKKLIDYLSDKTHLLNEEYNELYNNITDTFFSDKRCCVVVACMNREENLLKSLPSWFNRQYINQIVLVDYASEVPLFENPTIKSWVDDDYVEIVRVEQEEYFSLGKAYNIGIDHCESDYIIKIDADYKLKDPSFLDRFLTSPNREDYFIHGDYSFGLSMSGFFMIHMNHILFYREDLNGYGYDEIDLYKRIQSVHPIKNIIFFDIENYIYHIPHNNISRVGNYVIKDTITAESKNRFLCETKSFDDAYRLGYTRSPEGNILFNAQSIDNVFCINLESSNDRREYLSDLPFIDFVSAIDSRTNSAVYKDFGLEFKPVNNSHDLYFKCSSGAAGVYLSHMSIWKKMVDEDISRALIIEDDIDKDDLLNLFTSNIIFEPFDFVNLSFRFRWSGHRTLYDGAEAYILSKEGAEKLLRATYLPHTLKYVSPETYHWVNELEHEGKMDNKIDWSSSPAITCPLDKFIGYCCEHNANDLVRLDYNLYPFISLHKPLSENSNITEKNEQPWDYDKKQILKALT